ncbi:MAG: hypothetical protein AVDCRST_MAG77-1367, partial [uncultured Chloroflexi bacterium]
CCARRCWPPPWRKSGGSVRRISIRAARAPKTAREQRPP